MSSEEEKKNSPTQKVCKIALFHLIIVSFFFVIFTGCSSGNRAFVKKQLKKAQSKEHFTGFLLYDPIKKASLYDLNSNLSFTPASNIKILSLYTSLSLLGDSIPAMKYQIVNDTIYVKATGDPTLLHPNFENNNTIGFIKTNQASNVVLFTHHFHEQIYGPGWAWEDYTYSFMPERSAFPLYGNLLTVTKEKDSLKVVPDYFKTHIKFEKQTFHRSRRDQKFFLPENLRDTLQIPFITSDSLISNLLASETKKSIFLSANSFPYHNFKTLYSVPSDSVYKYMMAESDNFIAEQLLLLCSSVISDSLNTKLVINHMLNDKLVNIPHKPRWVDGSGLSRYNLITPASIVFVLNELYHSIPKQRLFNLFPAGGEPGTLKNMFTGQSPYVYAKSGSLSNNYSLSGYLKTRSGKVLIFSYMANHFHGSNKEIKKQLEIIIREIRDHY